MRRTSSMGLSFPPFTRAVKQLLIANGAVFLLMAVLGVFAPTAAGLLQILFELRPVAVVHGWIWQLVTYAFLHAGLLHILFNMLALWMFGAQLEQDWGYNLFMQFYFFCGVGAALITVAVSYTGLAGRKSSGFNRGRVGSDLRTAARLRHAACRLGDHAVSHPVHDQGEVLHHGT